MATWKKVIAIVGGALSGGLGVAAIVYPDMAVIFASVSGAVGLLVAGITGISLIKGE